MEKERLKAQVIDLHRNSGNAEKEMEQLRARIANPNQQVTMQNRQIEQLRQENATLLEQKTEIEKRERDAQVQNMASIDTLNHSLAEERDHRCELMGECKALRDENADLDTLMCEKLSRAIAVARNLLNRQKDWEKALSTAFKREQKLQKDFLDSIETLRLLKLHYDDAMRACGIYRGIVTSQREFYEGVLDQAFGEALRADDAMRAARGESSLTP